MLRPATKADIPAAPMNRAARGAVTLIGLIGILPFLNMYHTRPLVSFYSEWLAIVLGMAAGFVLLTRQFWLSVTIPRSAVYVFALAVLAALQSVLVPRPYTAQWLYPVLYLGWATLLMILASRLRQDLGKQKAVEILAWLIVVGGLLSAVTGLVQYLGYGGWLGEYVAFKQTAAIHGNIAQPNHFAAHILLATVGLCYLFAARRLSATLAAALLIFFALIAGLSASRAVFLYATALLALSLASCLRSRDTFSSRLCVSTALFLAAYVGAQPLLEHLNPWLTELLKDWSLNNPPGSELLKDWTLNNKPEAGITGPGTALGKLASAPSGLAMRVSEWHKAWLMFLDAPLFGVGFGNFAWHSFSYQQLPAFSAMLKPELFSHSHNLFAQVLAETGIAGFLLLLLLLVGWVRQLHAQWSGPDWFIAASLLVIFIHSNLEFPLWYAYFLGIAAFLLGLGDSRSVAAKLPVRAGQVGGGLLLLLGIFVLVETLTGYWRLVDIPVNPLISPRPEKISATRIVARNPLLTPYAELLLTAMMPTTKDGIAEKLAVTTRTFHRNPDVRKTYRQVTLLALDNQMGEAHALLHMAAQAYPHYLSGYIWDLRMLQKARHEPEIAAVMDEAKRMLQIRETITTKQTTER